MAKTKKKNKEKFTLSVVIPAYNEAERLKVTLPQILSFFEQEKYVTEIIIANDGSSDETSQVVREHQVKSKKLILKDLPKNLGKGGALRSGIAQTRGSWILFMDADLSTPMNEIHKFWQYTDEFDVIIGSRKTKGSDISKRQSFLRESLGKVFTWLTNLLATGNLSDVTCGFKLLRGRVGRKLFGKSMIDDWSFDAEILFLAKKFDHPIQEVPVKWHNDPRTKVNMLRDGLRAFLGLLQIRWNDITGKYGGDV